MYTVSASSTCNICSIVYKNTRRGAGRKLHCLRDKIEKRARTQIFFTNLDEVDTGIDVSFDAFEELMCRPAGSQTIRDVIPLHRYTGR